jgi:hypothetical protein
MLFDYPRYRFILCCLILMLLSCGCAGKKLIHSAPSAVLAGKAAETRPAEGRMIIWTASMTLEVDKISESVADIVSYIETNGGFIENKSVSQDKSAHLKLRVPSSSLTAVVDHLAGFGSVKNGNVSSRDVTETFIDTEARLKNAIALRDRLKALLDKAKDVSDILAIEKELTRVQSDIDSMEGRLKSLKGQIDYASIDLYLEQKTILGPLGIVFKGVSWFIGKLFVLN